MDIKVDSSTLILAAFTKALSETAPEEIAKVMTETLLQRADSRSYAANVDTVLDGIVKSAVATLARRVVEEVVESYKPQIEEQIRNQMNGMTANVTVAGGYNDKGITTSIIIGGDAAAGTT